MDLTQLATHMATLSITHSCGHEASHAMPAIAAERRQREAWLQRQPCPACWRQAQGRAAETKREEWNLPALEGREEETAWADVIRMKAIAHNRDYHARVVTGHRFASDEDDLKAATLAAADQALKELEGQTSAAWWIANRFESLTYIKRQILAAVTPILNERNKR